MLLRRKATRSFLLLWKSLLSSAVCVCLFESTLHLVASSDAMDQKEVGELLRLLNAARHSGVVDTKSA